MLATGLAFVIIVAALCAWVWHWNLEAFAVATRMLCPTRNMSWDIRGDPLKRPRRSYVWNNSEFGPLDPSLC